MSAKVGKYIGFCVYRRFYLLCPPVLVFEGGLELWSFCVFIPQSWCFDVPVFFRCFSFDIVVCVSVDNSFRYPIPDSVWPRRVGHASIFVCTFMPYLVCWQRLFMTPLPSSSSSCRSAGHARGSGPNAAHITSYSPRIPMVVYLCRLR